MWPSPPPLGAIWSLKVAEEKHFCEVPGCNRPILNPEATYCFCVFHWWDCLTTAKRRRIRDIYRRFAERRCYTRDVTRVEQSVIRAMFRGPERGGAQ